MIAPEIRSKLSPDAFISPRAQSNMVSPIGFAALRDGKNHIYFASDR
jgi:hypothetical protein